LIVVELIFVTKVMVGRPKRAWCSSGSWNYP
jgi:hypothetical protein